MIPLGKTLVTVTLPKHVADPKKEENIIFRNLANVVSILGVLPICILFGEHGFQFLIPLIVCNNIMDDLDGVLAAKLNIGSKFGACLDNACDAIAHTVFVMFVGMHYAQGAGHAYVGGVCLAASLLASMAIIVRCNARIDPTSVRGGGSPTNELIRHIFFVLLMAQIFGFEPSSILIAVFALHTVSMLAPFRMPYLIRSLTKSAIAIALVNVTLLVAWLVPFTAPVIALVFFVTYLYSLVVGGISWLKKVDPVTLTAS